MKKKVVILVVLVFCALSLAGCTNTEEYEKQIEELTSRVEELEEENTELKEGNELVGDGETVVLSGMIIVGTDIPAGAYDIKPAGSEDVGISVYENEAARDEDEYNYEWLFPGDEDNPEGDALKSYTLREGYILKMSSNTEFTKVN